MGYLLHVVWGHAHKVGVTVRWGTQVKVNTQLCSVVLCCLSGPTNLRLLLCATYDASLASLLLLACSHILHRK